MAAEDILGRFRSENVMQDELPKKSAILKSLNSMLAVKNSLALYKEFYKQAGILHLFVMPSRKTLEWADVYPCMYVRAAFEGLQNSVTTKHLVIDEMQDYTPVQYAVVNQIFPCQKTILGDFGQSLNPNHLHILEDLQRLYKGAEFVMLNKSYRSTYEIITFAKHIQNAVSMEPVKRLGEEPVLIPCADEEEEICRIIGIIHEFESGDKASLGIILKTRKAAEDYCHALSGKCSVSLITPETITFKNCVTVTSIQMSKGLEFDEVVIPGADSRTYSTEYDRSLLYIACTRAMHKLTLLYTGRRSKLIGET